MGISRLFFYISLLAFAFFSHLALGSLKNYEQFYFSYLLLFGALLALRCLNHKIFLLISWLLFLTSLGYLPSGLLYGAPSIGVAASVYETNPTEALGYFKTIPLSTYAFALLYVTNFALLLFLHRKTKNFFNTPCSFRRKISGFYLLALIAYSAFVLSQPLAPFQQTVQIGEQKYRYDFYPATFVSQVIKVNNDYFSQRALFNQAIHAQPQWQIESVQPRHQNNVLIIGESMRRDYLSLYGYPVSTTPFLSQVKGQVFDLYVAAGPNTQPSLQRSLYRSENQHQTTVYTDNIISLAKAAGFHTYWLSNQGKMGEYDTMAARIAVQADQHFFTSKGDYTFGNTPDSALLPELDKALQQASSQPKLIVLHLMGSHPPFCDRVEAQQAAREYPTISAEMSCYLASLKQTDDLLAQIQQRLQQQNQSYSVLYFSDHGLAHLGEGKDLTMLNNKEFKQSYAVPLVVFDSEAQRQTRIQNPQSAFNFMDGFAQWLGIKESHLNQQDFFNPPTQSIKVFDWHGLVDYDSLKEDPALRFKSLEVR